jgi:hypothetical protein
MKEYVYDKRSECPPRDSIHASTRLLHPFKDGGVVEDSLAGIHSARLNASPLLTGAAYASDF